MRHFNNIIAFVKLAEAHSNSTTATETLRTILLLGEIGRRYAQLDRCHHVVQLHRLLLAEQNQDFMNKYWLSNHSAEIEINHFAAGKSVDARFGIGEPVRITFLVESQWERLKIEYAQEHEIPQILSFEALVRENLMAEIVLSSNSYSSRNNFALLELIQVGTMPENVSRQTLDKCTSDIQTTVSLLEQKTAILP
jgi:hypothetical protein